MKRATGFVFCLAALGAALAHAAPAPPAAGVWNIATTGRAASSGDLEFRITSTDGSDPVEITVPVIAGASQDSMARTIRRALSAQLPGDRFNVQLGEAANVLVSDTTGQPNFSLELIDSNIDDVRVAVQSVTPAAGPTVPAQSVPAVPPPGNAAPGNATQPPNSSTPIPPPSGVPAPDIPAPPPGDGAPPSTPAPSPNAPAPNPNAPPPGSQAPSRPAAPAPVPGAPAPSPGAPSPGAAAPAPGASAPAPGASVPTPGGQGGVGAGASAPPPD